MLISYPAIFYYNEEEGYYVYFPDLEGSGTQGDNITEAMEMASDYLGIMVSHIIENGEELPKVSDINNISVRKDYPFKNELKNHYDFNKSFTSIVLVDLSSYLTSKELIKKTLTIPLWANNIGVKKNVNFSNLLTEALAKLSINY